MDLDAERLTSNTLYLEIDLLNSYLDVKDRKIKNLTEQTVVQDSILTEYEIQKEAIESDLRKTQRKLKLTKVTRFLGFGGGVAIGAYAMYLINRFVTINR